MKTWKCYRCTMTFRVGNPNPNISDDGITRCKCGQRFWHTAHSLPMQKSIVGIFPEDDPRTDFKPAGVAKSGFEAPA